MARVGCVVYPQHLERGRTVKREAEINLLVDLLSVLVLIKLVSHVGFAYSFMLSNLASHAKPSLRLPR